MFLCPVANPWHSPHCGIYVPMVKFGDLNPLEIDQPAFILPKRCETVTAFKTSVQTVFGNIVSAYVVFDQSDELMEG
jgi:hypothetical protein